MSSAKLKKFEKLYAAGWDACAVTGKLIAPKPRLTVDQIAIGDGLRVRNPQLSFCGEVVKVNRVNLVVASSVWGNPVEYKIRKSDCIGGQVDRNGIIFKIGG